MATNERAGRKRLGSVFSLALFLLTCGPVYAGQEPKLELLTSASKEIRVKKDGRWVVEHVPADKPKIGDRVVYTVTYRNTGNSPAVDAVIVDPVPRGLEIVPESAGGKDAEVFFSIDSGKTFRKPPVMVEMTKPGGTRALVPARPETYTHVKWIVKKPVPPGRSGQVSFAVTVK
jgi:uncharacterized repeat protein (TIGR01451 family)